MNSPISTPERIKNLCANGHDKDVVGVNSRRWCKQCARNYQNKWYWKNPDRDNARKRRYRRKKTRSNPDSHVYKSSVPNLRKVRESLGLSQEQFGRLCSVSRSMIGDIERGDRKASPSTQRKILGAIVKIREARREREQLKKRLYLT